MAVVKQLNKWPTGLFDCFSDCGTCCMGYWLTPCLYGQNAEKLGGSCFSDGLLFCLFGACCPCLFTSNRSKLRANHALAPEPCNDCCVMCCCPACAVCQEARVLSTHGPAPQFHQAAPGMVAPQVQAMAE